MVSLKNAMNAVYEQDRENYWSQRPEFTVECCFVDAHFDQINEWARESVDLGYYITQPSDMVWSLDAPYRCVKRAFERVLPKQVKVIVNGHGNKNQPPRIVMGTYREME